MRIAIRNGLVVDPASGLEKTQTITIDGDRIAAIGAEPAGFAPDRVIDAAGQVVMPGLVDLAARLREPGFEYRATLASELHAAVAGGVTTLVCPPDTDPPLDEPGLVEMLRHRARNLHLANVHPLGALTAKLEGERLAEYTVLAESGCIAFSQGDAPIVNTQVLWRAMQYAATFGYAVWLRPQDPHLARGGVAHDGEIATRLGLAGIPTIAETIALATVLRLVRETGARVHVCRVSSAESVDLLRAARREGLPVTSDVGVHHLHLSDIDIGYYDSNCHVVPPFRSVRDRDALQAAVADGTIDAICSDHTPVDDDEKQLPFGEAEPGVTGLELLLPLTLRWARQANLPFARALARVTTDPARVLGIDAGRIAVGAAADLCVFDPDRPTRVTMQHLRSQGRNTPFIGHELQGAVTATLVGGTIVHQAG